MSRGVPRRADAAACAQPPPEQRLRETVDGLQAALDERDSGGIGDRLAADFIGPDGLDRDGAIRMARLSFLRYRVTDFVGGASAPTRG